MKKKYDNLSTKELIAVFKQACENRDVTTMAHIFNNEYSNYTPYVNNQLVKACSENNLFMVDFLLTYPILTKNADIGFDNNEAFMVACASNAIDVVRFLLTSPKLKEKMDIDAYGDFDTQGIAYACSNGHLELVKYLLTSPELDKHSSIFAGGYNNFYNACRQDQVEVVRYLLDNKFLKLSDLLESEFIKMFKYLCSKEKHKVIEYFIIEKEMKLKDLPDAWIANEAEFKDNKTCKYVLRLIENRELNKKLNKDLVNKEVKHKPQKI